ncbi:Hypothetical protein NTJ_01536 [Nesidiocoris tenuis]|uniref:Odorant receptor n=1 Tax=Nesidiocoris tenuis TaxID=355587 RepID=A0ABN7ABP3_9HEMI|nr:Hypothetical protein NTJ_01536 [Nesidiocoris tenuis]
MRFRASEDLAGIFKYYLSSFYYGGALALCMSGILAVADNEDKENSLKFLGILTGELVAISLATYVSEGIKTGFADIATTLYDTPWYNYPPKSRKRLHLMITSCPSKGLRTALGFELTLFHLADMLNASYKYYNLLLLTIKE